MVRTSLMAIGLFVFLLLNMPAFSQTNFWERAGTDGVPPSNVSTLSVTETEICAATHEGVFCSVDDGETWTAVRQPFTGSRAVYVFLKLDDNRFITSKMRLSATGLGGSGLFYSHDSGNNWDRIDSRSLAWSMLALPDGRIFIGEHGPRSLGFGAGVSADSGRSWVSFNNGLGPIGDIYSLRLTPSGSVLASSFDDLFLLAPGDTTWRSLGLADRSPVWTALETPDGNLFAVTGDYWAPGNGVMRSADGGSTWIQFNEGLTNLKIRDLIIDVNGLLWVATDDSGVFVSSAGEDDWQPQNAGLGNLHVNDLIFGSSGRLFAGTDDGVYRSIDSFVTSVQLPEVPLPEGFTLQQNYPNPFNPTTRITYSIPQAGSVELKIFNLIGEEVEVLVRGFQQAGSYSTDFDAGTLGSGVYIYRLSVDGQSQQSKKMLLVR